MRQVPIVLAVSAALASVCCSNSTTIAPGPGPITNPPLPTTAVLVGAGDIADCENDGGRPAEETAKLLDRIDGTVFAAGDLAYPSGSEVNFRSCYQPRWGRHLARTRPAPGNHEYESPGAFPYYLYFGPLAGPIAEGYYSYDLASWHVVVINSNIGTGSGTAQWTWLRNDLADSRAMCTAAYWHHPRFTSGPSRGGEMLDIWRLLYTGGVDIVINGHDHFYERFAPQDPDGRGDAARGVRQFTVGTGGAPLYPFVTSSPNSQFRVASYGVLKLTLQPTGYDWAFIQAVTESVLDSGSAPCH